MLKQFHWWAGWSVAKAQRFEHLSALQCRSILFYWEIESPQVGCQRELSAQHSVRAFYVSVIVSTAPGEAQSLCGARMITAYPAMATVVHPAMATVLQSRQGRIQFSSGDGSAAEEVLEESATKADDRDYESAPQTAT